MAEFKPTVAAVPIRKKSDMELLELIHSQVIRTNEKLDQHLADEHEVYRDFRSDIHSLQKEMALHKQRSGFINAFIASVVAGVTAWLVGFFTFK